MTVRDHSRPCEHGHYRVCWHFDDIAGACPGGYEVARSGQEPSGLTLWGIVPLAGVDHLAWRVDDEEGIS